MEYKRKLITLPTELADRLSKERNQSATTAEALERYFAGKDGTKALAKLVQDNTESLDDLAEAVQEMVKLQRQVINFMRSQGANI